MKLIHSGKVLKDDEKIESCNIKPNDFLVVMIAKVRMKWDWDQKRKQIMTIELKSMEIHRPKRLPRRSQPQRQLLPRHRPPQQQLAHPGESPSEPIISFVAATRESLSLNSYSKRSRTSLIWRGDGGRSLCGTCCPRT